MSHLMHISKIPQRPDEALELGLAVEFGTPFRTLPGGYVVQAEGYFGLGHDVYVPETVYADEGDPYTLFDAKGWRALRGYTGQYGYSGPIMHVSEFMGGRMAEDILSTPGVYVLVVVDNYMEDDDNPEGWAVLKLIDDPMSEH